MKSGSAKIAKVLAICLAFAPLLLAAQEFHNVSIFSSDFEDGSLQGWHGRGTGTKLEKLSVVTGKAHGGSKALEVSDRTATWQGPQHLLDDNVVPGDTYRVAAWLFYDQGPATAAFTLSVERSFKDAKAGHKYNNVASFQVKKGEWTLCTADYTIGEDPTQKAIELYFERPFKDDASATSDDCIPFYIDDVSVLKLDPAMKPKVQEDLPNLIDVWKSSFTVGTAVSPDTVDPAEAHAQLVMKHFGAITAGNAMKWDSLEPKEGQFDWTDADKIVQFGSLTGMRVRGHTLVWHNQTPAWVFQDPKDPSKPASKDLLLARLKTYIQTVVGHYKGQIDSWDVVNEVISDKAGLRTGEEGSKWYAIAGADYIPLAFKWAHEADPDAILVLNDYNLESNSAKLAEAVKLVKELKTEAVPIQAVGLQMHVQIAYPDKAKIQDAIDQLAALGVKIQVTELDVSIYQNASESKKEATVAILLAQAQRYKDLFGIFQKAAAKGQLDLVMVWGVADDGTWLNDFPVAGRPDAPLLFDRRLQAKPSFWALADPTKVKGLQ